LEEHDARCRLKSTPENCAIHSFGTKVLFFTEQEIGQLNPDFDFTFLRPNLNTNLLKDNLIQLRDFPEVAKIYQAALNKLNEDQNERNILDDLRLSLEILLKKLLINNKSLENQLNDIGSYVKGKGVSNEVRNMFTTLLDYYSKYQNNYVKHNDLVKREEIDLIVNLTSAFISFLINK
jgi:transcriptional accessory protein Tex/SPT6